MGDTITSLSLVELRALLLEAVRQAHDGLHAVAGALPGLEDSERKRALMSQLHASRQQLQRLGVVVAWSAKARAVAECRRVMQAAAVHAAALQDAADQLAYLHSELTATAAPAYDIATAVQVTEQGSYNLLPSSIEEHAGVSPARPPRSTVRAALAQLDFLIRAKLLQNPRPEGMAVRSISAGVLTLGGAGGLYTARLTLVPAPEERVAQVPQAWARAEGDGAPAVGGPASSAASAPATAKVKHPAAGWRWRLLSLDLLPEYRGREGLAPPQLLAWLQSVLEQRMWAAADVATLRGAGLGDLVAVGDPGAAGDARPTSSERSAPTSDAPGASSLPARSTLCLGAAGLGDESSGHEKCGAGSGPAPSPSPGPDALRLMHEALTRGAARAALASIVVPDARRLEGAEGWAGRLRLERAREGTGIRLRYWLDHPPVTLHELEALQGRSSNGSGAALPATSHALAAPDASAAAHAPPEAPAQAPSIEVALGADAESLAVQLPEAGLLQRVLAARAAMQLAALEGHLSAAPLGACMRCRLVVAEKEAVEPWSAAHEDVPITIATDPQPARLPRLEVWAGGCHDAGDTDGEASPASRPALTLGVDRQTGQYELLQVGEEARGGDAAGVTRPEAATTVAPPSGAGAAAGSSRAGVATASPEPSPLRRELSGALAAAAREALASPLPVGRSRATQAVALAAAVAEARLYEATARGLALRQLGAPPLPGALWLGDAGAGRGPLDGCVPAEPANGAAPTRKRGRGWPEGAVEPTGAPGAEAPVMAKALSPGPPQRRLTLVQALRWARREGLWRQLGHQLDAQGLAASEEWRWVGAPESGGPSPMGGAAHAKPGAAGLAAREFLGGSASEPAPCGAYARFWLHGDRGEWRGELDSRYFASRAARLRDAGVELQDGCDGKAPAVEVVRCGRRGLELAGSFQRGQSVLRGVAALLSSLRLHLCLARCMARCRAAPEVEHENGEVAGEEGAAHANGGAEAKRTVSACTWRLPGSCRCRLASAGLLSATFVVEGRGPSAHGPLLTAEVSWETLGAGRGTGGGAGPGVSELGTPRASGGSPECRVLCRPEVPAALAARLAALLEAGPAGAPAPETAASVADADVQPSLDSSSKPAAAVASAPGTAEGDAAGRDPPPRTCTLWIPEAAVEQAATTVLQAVGGAW
ncbi:Putative mediator of RNA polymerase II transcription subunit 14 [Auxenochlorella protothecoides]|uniref:Mediator of RNA polymerase II transcription subunit 14 n=1 Tax=Auxenochlorella protothecoides TaxID=3075 RepID=A0A087SH67_AUXPR|nr:Putative mediator of RNA polymerase II transcription subunit 14 [Auxenochlorella protothecoides]KFM25071.1 Putative mediator of RNA polymerase II transcription subunit 14 [Auxenochlorella protothecoides]